MIKTGHFLDLKLKRPSPNGWYLTDEEGFQEVLLPNKYVPENAAEGQIITVFVYRDSEDRIIATTQTPKIELYRFAYLRVAAATKIGAFMDWGLEKDLLVPFKEQHEKLKTGDFAVIFLSRDEVTDRLLGSARIHKWLQKEQVSLKPNTQVELLVFEEVTAGYKVIINHRYQGILYRNEVFQPLKVGDQLHGYVRKVRDNGQVDVSANPLGRNKVTGHVEVLLEALKSHGGFLPFHDKTPSEEIQNELAMSKKAFKEAVGKLYKERKIVIEEKGLRILPKFMDGD